MSPCTLCGNVNGKYQMTCGECGDHRIVLYCNECLIKVHGYAVIQTCTQCLKRMQLIQAKQVWHLPVPIPSVAWFTSLLNGLYRLIHDSEARRDIIQRTMPVCISIGAMFVAVFILIFGIVYVIEFIFPPGPPGQLSGFFVFAVSISMLVICWFAAVYGMLNSIHYGSNYLYQKGYLFEPLFIKEDEVKLTKVQILTRFEIFYIYGLSALFLMMRAYWGEGVVFYVNLVDWRFFIPFIRIAYQHRNQINDALINVYNATMPVRNIVETVNINIV